MDKKREEELIKIIKSLHIQRCGLERDFYTTKADLMKADETITDLKNRLYDEYERIQQLVSENNKYKNKYQQLRLKNKRLKRALQVKEQNETFKQQTKQQNINQNYKTQDTKEIIQEDDSLIISESYTKLNSVTRQGSLVSMAISDLDDSELNNSKQLLVSVNKTNNNSMSTPSL